MESDRWGPPRDPDRRGIIPLRPLTGGEILAAGLAVLREQPRSVYALSAIVAVLGVGTDRLIVTVLQAPASPTLANPLSLWERLLGYAGLGFIVQTVLTTWLMAAVTAIVADAVVGGRTTPRAAWSRILPDLPRLAGLGLTARAVTVLVPVLGWPILSGGWALAVPALVLERGGVFGSLGRSWRLTRSALARVWTIRTLATGLAALATYAVRLPIELALLGNWLPSTIRPAPLVQQIPLVLDVVLATVTAPFPMAVQAVLYVDQRIRLENLAARLPGTSTDPTVRSPAPTS
ncbi:MAG TPA: hypothetical protein VNG13_12430 [Mycobacteriales bacterium]|nr:hypothetical protein [Mycobacteriales bacterium]